MDILQTLKAITSLTSPEVAFVFIILVGVVVLLGYFALQLMKQNQATSENLLTVTEAFSDKITRVIEESYKNQQMTTNALTEIKIVLAEIKSRVRME